jgi:hypothetical protein
MSFRNALYSYSTQESVADSLKRYEARYEDAKRCDYPPCNASAADKNMNKLKKCPRCNEGRYCCQVHCNLDWDRHKILCQDIKLKVGLFIIECKKLPLTSPHCTAIPDLTQPLRDTKQLWVINTYS